MNKWYLNSWFIALLFVFSFLIIPFIAGVVLLVLQRKEFTAIKTKADKIDDIETFEINAKKDIEILKKKTDAQLNKKVNEADALVAVANSELKTIRDKINSAQKELETISADILEKNVTPYAFDGSITSEEYKNKLSLLKIKISDMIKCNSVVKTLYGSTTPKSKMHTNNTKQLIRCFNSESQNIIGNVSAKNIDTCRSKLQKSFETLNKIFETDNIALTIEYLDIKLEELHIVYCYQQKKEQEREEQRAIREQMLEEEKVRREIEREKAKIEKEEHQFKNEITKLMGYLQKASDIEKQLYVDKIKELEKKLKSLEKDKENVLQREQNTRAGYVYVISNIGSFGEDVYKIGMTRRLEPMDRVKELGDASVPFEFDVHAMIFSDDAPALEHILHQKFKKYQVNKVNDRKEFFRVPLDEIEKVVKEKHNATVTFTKVAEAVQYRESLRLAKAM